MPQGYNNADWAASGGVVASWNPYQLFTAEDDIKTTTGLVKTNQNLLFGTIVAFDAVGALVPWTIAVPANPEAFVAGIMAVTINTTVTGYNADTRAPYYVGGCFNPALLVWPVALATRVAREAALARFGSPFRTKPLL